MNDYSKYNMSLYKRSISKEYEIRDPYYIPRLFLGTNYSRSIFDKKININVLSTSQNSYHKEIIYEKQQNPKIYYKRYYSKYFCCFYE